MTPQTETTTPRLKFGHDESIAIRDRETRKLIAALRQKTMQRKFAEEFLEYLSDVKIGLARYGDEEFIRTRLEARIADKIGDQYPWEITKVVGSKNRAKIRRLYKITLPRRLRLDLVGQSVCTVLTIVNAQTTLTN